MKRQFFNRTLLITGLVIGAAWSSPAQRVGLPVFDTADRRDPGRFEIMPGAAFGEDMDFIGARASYSLLDELRGFIDLGRLQTDNQGSNLALQAGGLFSLPMFDFCETAIRAAGYYANTDYMDIIGCDLMLVCSGETLLDDLYVYSGFGIDFSERKLYTSHSEVNPAVAGGLCYQFSKNFQIFLEGDYVDGLYAAAGLSFRP